QVHGRPVVTRRLAPADPLEGLHAVFVGRAAPAGVRERLRGRAILVVAEDGLEPGVMLNFVPVAGRVRFEASPVAAERVGLKLGARLLAVAERVAVQ
ncbi:MAG TPA: YfiR family protein, partial [Rubrivivax sp.]|nr:YfiR family protein [Rubrivivax sp.]